jgi:lipopolysaccharide/colanic/teichoic acid biosynthesis glycosyltransferase
MLFGSPAMFRARRRAQRAWLLLRIRFAERRALARRAIDIAAAGAGLLALAPLFAITALAIKATSAGPVFYRQERIGRQGRRFWMWKFRTMVQNAEGLKTKLSQANATAVDGVRFKMRRDPRITRVGRVLRKLSIDELPQLWNVVVGDMTLVGPRPPVWREVALYDARAFRRLEVQQGLTCLWQIGGRSDLSFDEQVELDIDYIDRITPLEELMIVAKTIPAVVTGRGAY